MTATKQLDRAGKRIHSAPNFGKRKLEVSHWAALYLGNHYWTSTIREYDYIAEEMLLGMFPGLMYML